MVGSYQDEYGGRYQDEYGGYYGVIRMNMAGTLLG